MTDPSAKQSIMKATAGHKSIMKKTPPSWLDRPSPSVNNLLELDFLPRRAPFLKVVDRARMRLGRGHAEAAYSRHQWRVTDSKKLSLTKVGQQVTDRSGKIRQQRPDISLIDRIGQP